jgi:hypothetical protein
LNALLRGFFALLPAQLAAGRNFLQENIMNTLLRNALAVAGVLIATQASAEVTFYEHEGFKGRTFSTEKRIGDFERYGFNDRASSAVVQGERWEVCQDARFGGRCVILRPGRYASLGAMDLNDRVSSARMVGKNARFDDDRYAPAPVINSDYQRRDNERLYEAYVTSAHAVLGPAERRCWVEREEIAGEHYSNSANVPAAIAGALVGGILGHQVGGGRGQDIATAGGVAGAALGANIGRDGQQASTREVQRCASTPNQARPEFWEVTYSFRGQEHRLQMSAHPGRTVTVNARGEPRE